LIVLIERAKNKKRKSTSLVDDTTRR